MLRISLGFVVAVFAVSGFAWAGDLPLPTPIPIAGILGGPLGMIVTTVGYVAYRVVRKLRS